MRFAPRSLAGRLLLASTILIVVALFVAAGLTALVLDRFIHRQIDQQLDAQIRAVAAALVIGPNGRLGLAHGVDGPPFDRPGFGWYWQATSGADVVRSGSLGNADLAIPRTRSGGPRDLGPRPLVADGPGPDNRPLHFRVLTLPGAGRAVTIAATAPGPALDLPLAEAMSAVLVSFVIAGGALLLAMFLQVRLGLKPLEKLRESVAAVRAGKLDQVPADQPSEVAPLVAELNSLIKDNAEGLARARRHVANLAHGLKTPLASLAVALAAPDRDPGGELERLVTLMDRRIRHHLGRARAAALGGAARAQTPLGPRIADIVLIVRKIYADKPLAIDTAVGPSIGVACEAQDVDEMLGNLVDNAVKWAAGRVRVSASSGEGRVVVQVEDDGPGLPEDRIPDVIRPGHRLDESSPGYGFGLPITRELAELYGGGLDLARSELGGLKVTLTLPAVR